ncbi:replication initiation protein (plasmid) [Paenibacillus rhizovicinus]|uniref:Replication initiation protein n=1 Tax=Paenibacillus rhizovicinus TaxID=2704463 RepID=A0A6C0PA58_9BACL|nr:replication initiation protein [Paenibacillus rhizovicinus]QHW35490.1 replication initiation protein [Paenibacillus rhizovicinus]
MTDDGDQISFDFEADKISDHYIVTESNALIESRTNLDLYEERLIYILASRINPDDTHFQSCFFKVKDIADKLELTEKNFYKRIREIIQRLQRKTVVIEDKSTNSTIEAQWLSASRYFHGKGMIELEFSQMLGPYLLQLKNNFTNYKLWNVLYLKSFYSSKLYKLLKQYLPLGKRRFSTLKELKDKLEIEEGNYEKYSHLKNRVILTAQRELLEKTDIKFELEEIKNGNKIVGVVFHIFPNSKSPRLALNDAEYIDNEPITDLLGRFEINRKAASELVKEYGENQIRMNIKYVFEKQRNAEIGSVSGYIIKAIKENYAAMNPEYVPEDDKDRNTSIVELNKRIDAQVRFYDQCVKEKIHTKSEAERMQLQGIIDEINKVSDWRIRKKMRPLVENDITLPIGKKAFVFHS